MCGGRHRITESWLSIQKEIHDEMEDTFVHPDCWKCNKKLEIGDYVDGFHPYHQEYNLCIECETKHAVVLGQEI